MPVTAPIAGVAASSAAIAAAGARRAEEEECRLDMKQFDPKSASIEDQQHYAHCVQLINPKETPHEVIMVGKGAIIFMFILMAWGGIKGFGYVADESPLEGVFFGFMFGILSLLVLGLFFGALAFLLS